MLIQLSPSLEPGQPAPDVAALKGYAGKWLVLFFYPRDFTSGCTAESCAFRDAYQAFQKAGAQVVGVSGDSVETHRAFAAEHRLPYPLVADGDAQIRRAFGVPHVLGRLSGRTTFVIDPQGIIRYVFDSRSRALDHVSLTLEFLNHAR